MMGAARLRTVPVGVVRAVAMVVCAGGIAGMIVGSVADNNGVAVTFGLVTAAAALSLIAIFAVTPGRSAGRITPIDDTEAQALEAAIQQLVGEGADEGRVRQLVRHALELGERRHTGR